MVKKVSIAFVVAAVGVGLAAGTVPEGKAGPVAAKAAFWEMYKPAHAWAADILVLSLSSNDVAGVKSEAGKSGMWTAVFASPGRSEARTFTYSVAGGISAGPAQRWTGSTPQSRAFPVRDFAVDSDAVYQTAFTKAGAWLKQHPGKQASFTLGNASRFPAPVWYVMWGNKTSGYGVFVSAVTGTIIKGK